MNIEHVSTTHFFLVGAELNCYQVIFQRPLNSGKLKARVVMYNYTLFEKDCEASDEEAAEALLMEYLKQRIKHIGDGTINNKL